MSLDEKVAKLAAEYRSLGAKILAEVVRIPADHVKTDPSSGLSNHEGPRLEYLKKTIVEIGAVRRPEDVFFDDFGSEMVDRWYALVDDGIYTDVVVMDG